MDTSKYTTTALLIKSRDWIDKVKHKNNLTGNWVVIDKMITLIKKHKMEEEL